ncbi:MAG: transporter ATP-binding protein [Acidimicrobiales bacterium]|nr:transporter ATP-binding protein [Acidimicrobiales bacterium]
MTVDAATGGSPAALDVQGLALSFGDGHPGTGVTVFDGLDLTVAAGEFLAIVGPSGCGKSTLLRVVAGLLDADAGRVVLGGADVVGRPGRVAYMPQKDDLLPWRRALGNAVLGAEINGVPKAAARARALPLFERFGLAGFERSWPAQLSGGMRQRLALLRTFLVDRPVLLLDEPFGALDAITRRSMQAWLQDVWLADRRTVVFVTHDVEEALWLADRVVVLSGRPGRVLAEVDVAEPRPRDLRLVTEPAFVQQRAEVLAALEG